MSDLPYPLSPGTQASGAQVVADIEQAEANAEAASDTAGAAASAQAAAQSTGLQKAQNLSDLTNPSAARANLGLGTAATHAATDFAAEYQIGQTISADDPQFGASGTTDTARLNAVGSYLRTLLSTTANGVATRVVIPARVWNITGPVNWTCLTGTNIPHLFVQAYGAVFLCSCAGKVPIDLLGSDGIIWKGGYFFGDMIQTPRCAFQYGIGSPLGSNIDYIAFAGKRSNYFAANVGNGTVSNIVTSGATVQGEYTLTATGATTFAYAGQGGVTGTVTVGTTFSDTTNGIAFKINAGSTPFIAGDSFTLVGDENAFPFHGGSVAFDHVMTMGAYTGAGPWNVASEVELHTDCLYWNMQTAISSSDANVQPACVVLDGTNFFGATSDFCIPLAMNPGQGATIHTFINCNMLVANPYGTGAPASGVSVGMRICSIDTLRMINSYFGGGGTCFAELYAGAGGCKSLHFDVHLETTALASAFRFRPATATEYLCTGFKYTDPTCEVYNEVLLKDPALTGGVVLLDAEIDIAGITAHLANGFCSPGVYMTGRLALGSPLVDLTNLTLHGELVVPDPSYVTLGPGQYDVISGGGIQRYGGEQFSAAALPLSLPNDGAAAASGLPVGAVYASSALGGAMTFRTGSSSYNGAGLNPSVGVSTAAPGSTNAFGGSGTIYSGSTTQAAIYSQAGVVGYTSPSTSSLLGFAASISAGTGAAAYYAAANGSADWGKYLSFRNTTQAIDLATSGTLTFTRLSDGSAGGLRYQIADSGDTAPSLQVFGSGGAAIASFKNGGVIEAYGSIKAAGVVYLGVFTIASLPAAITSANANATCTDALSVSGVTNTLLECNGTQWKSANGTVVRNS